MTRKPSSPQSSNPGPKKALITGITGQDGAYRAEFLLNEAYRSTASSDAHRSSTPTASTTSTRIRKRPTASSSGTTATSPIPAA